MVMNRDPLGQGPLRQNPLTDPRIAEQMMAQSGTPVQQLQQPQLQGQQITAPPPPAQLTAEQRQQLIDQENADIPGMSSVMGAEAVDPWSALAQTLAAGYLGSKGRKTTKEKVKVLENAIRAEAEKEAKADRRTIKREDASDKRAIASDLRAERNTVVQEQYGQAAADKAARDPKTSGRIGVYKEYYDSDGNSQWRAQNTQGDVLDQKGNISSLDGLTTKAPPKAKPVPSLIRRKVADAQDIFRKSNNLIADYEGRKDEDGIKNSSMLEMARGVGRFISPELTNTLETVARDPKEMAILDRTEDLSAGVLHEKYGGAFTGGEGERGKRWDPSTLGIDDDRTIGRLEIIRDKAKYMIENLLIDYPDTTEEDHDMWLQQIEDQTAPPPPAVGAEEVIDEVEMDDASVDALIDTLIDEGKNDAEIQAMLRARGVKI